VLDHASDQSPSRGTKSLLETRYLILRTSRRDTVGGIAIELGQLRELE
jgi:hypothetical protein